MRFAVVVALVLGLGTPALAQQGGKKAGDKFFDFEGLVIDGELRKPGAFFTQARDRAKFDRLLRLRKSFLKKIVLSARDPALSQK